MPYNFTISDVNSELGGFLVSEMGMVSFDMGYLLYCLFIVVVVNVVVGLLILVLLLLLLLLLFRLINAECCDCMALHARC